MSRLNILMPQVIAMFFYRFIVIMNGGVWRIKVKINQLNDGFLKRLFLVSYETMLDKKGSWIGYNSIIEGAPIFPHGISGVFISGDSRIGKNCVIYQQVTIGSNTIKGSDKNGSPSIGDNCFIGAGAKIIGKVQIGNNCRIGANCVVVKDMPDNSVAVLQPTKIIKKENLDNRFFTKKEDGWYYAEDGKLIKAKD